MEIHLFHVLIIELVQYREHINDVEFVDEVLLIATDSGVDKIPTINQGEPTWITAYTNKSVTE